MSKITLDNLSNNLKEYLENAGSIDPSIYQEKTDETLQTEDKTIVGAINELFQSANNGKQLIANAIGNELITVDSTFSAMSEAILGLRRNTENETDSREVLYNMMVEDGYNEATNSMTVDELIELLDDSQIEIGDIKQIACGGYHTFILKNDGSLYSCGYNNKGQLGLNDTNDRHTFTQVTTNINNDVKQISCGYYYTFILKNDGSIYSCGNNYYGQLGLNDTTNRSTFTKVTTNINNDVKQISCSNSGHTVILKNDGSVYSCGLNDYRQLGLGDTTNRTTFTKVTTNINNDVKQVSCGNQYTFILKNDGSVWSCGYNGYGQLGFDDTTNKSTFTQVTTNINNDVKQISCGSNHTFILKNDNSVYSCGYNAYGRLGLGDTTNKTTFTQVTTNINNDIKQVACGEDYTFIVKTDGSIWGCGRNGHRQLGLGNIANKSTFTQVTTNINNDVSQVDCGSYHTFILKIDGSIYSCGYNNYGQLGFGDITDRSTFTNTNFYTPLSDYELNRQKLYYYLLDNEIEVTESMDIGAMLNLLVDNYINNMILGYENNLRILLQDEGVSISENDDMTSLITKVDEEFDRQVVPAGDAVASDVLSGKTFMNNSGELLTGNVTKMSEYTQITSGNVNNNGAAVYISIPSGAYTTPSVLGKPEIFLMYKDLDANLVPENIVSGKSICGVTGTAKAAPTIVSGTTNTIYTSEVKQYSSGIYSNSSNTWSTSWYIDTSSFDQLYMNYSNIKNVSITFQYMCDVGNIYAYCSNVLLTKGYSIIATLCTSHCYIDYGGRWYNNVDPITVTLDQLNGATVRLSGAYCTSQPTYIVQVRYVIRGNIQ